MSIGLVGRKCGMTRVFSEDGASIPVTVIEATPNLITQIKSLETDGYSAIQVTTGSVKAAHDQPQRLLWQSDLLEIWKHGKL